jgi:chromatin segregation and condensation protein Rec8/ScpA/Scc1 (kleisin family)
VIQEENILKVIFEKQSWEEIIYHIVSIEKLNPWDVDLVKLAGGFIRFISQVEELDFRIPAKVVFVAGILLRLKAEYLTLFEEEEELVKEEKPKEEITIPKLAEIGIPLKRIPKRQITLEELIHALRKALAVRERREERKIKAKMRVEAEISEEDVRKRIEEVMGRIDELMQKLRVERITFGELVPRWERKEIVRNFIPVLHLDQDKRIRAEQEEFFREIFISKQT